MVIACALSNLRCVKGILVQRSRSSFCFRSHQSERTHFTMGGGKVIECQTKSEWDQHINSGKIVIVDFSATWCGPCQMIGPVFVKLSEQYPDVLFLKVDVDQNATVAQECGISAMPTFQVFQDGAKVDEMVGASKDKLAALVEKWGKA